MSPTIFTALRLANGSVIENRLVKAAMEENMAVTGQLPDESLFRLYRRWSQGGAGLIITGNVMVHAEALTGPAGVVLDAQAPLEPFRQWAVAAKSGGSRVWMQINHPGRQVMANMPGVAWGPSAVRVDIGRNSKRLAQPVEMTAEQISTTVARFAETARRAEQAGFDGVEIHAAHGYLLSQFLSPLSNRRTDQWGGTLANRARLLLDTVRAVRSSVSNAFTVAVKLNSADFQRGGFDADLRSGAGGVEAPAAEHPDDPHRPAAALAGLPTRGDAARPRVVVGARPRVSSASRPHHAVLAVALDDLHRPAHAVHAHDQQPRRAAVS